ncbi:TPA: mitochondrial thiamine pyrophosphate transporter [Trebouxia sp. C0004]
MQIINANYFFTAAFTIEVVLQSIAKNFIIGPNGTKTLRYFLLHVAYLKNGWSWLDFITTLTSYTPYLPGNATDVSSLRAFRSLRPLRTISAHPGIRLLVNTLISAIPLLLDVVLLLAWVFFVFGIIGMQLFMGRLLGRCHPLDPSTLQPEAVPENMTDLVCNPVQSSGTYDCGDGYVCLNGDYGAFYGDVSFDNIGRALLQVLQVVSLESWSTTQMYYLLDGIGNVVVIYYFCLIVIGTYFALNLLVAVISAKFAQLHVDNQKAILARDRAAPNISANVRFYSEFLVSMLLKREDLVPWAEQSYARRVARRIVDHTWFNRFVMSIVLVNMVIMAMYHADMSDGFANALEATNLVLTILFTMEMVIKHAALGILGYWSNGFNVLDGIIVIASLVDLGLQYSGQSNSHGGGGVSSLRVLRLLRVFRSLKLLRQVEGLNKIVNIVLKSMVALRDFMLLLLLFIFIFMVLGIQLFGGNPYYTPANTASWRKGFASFYESFYTLFEALTGESWTGNIWNSMAAVGPAACLFWIAWDIIGHKILLNLFLAILINNFQDQEEVEQEGSDQDALSPRSPASNQVVPFGNRAGGGADVMWGDPYPSSRMGTLEGRQLEGRNMLSPPALGSSRCQGNANDPSDGRRSSQEGLWGRLSSQEAIGGISRQSLFGGLSALASSLGSPEGNGRRSRRNSTENAGTSPGGRAPPLGAAAKRGSFFMPDLPRQSGPRDFEHMHNFTKLVRGQAPQPGAYHNVLRMRRWLVSLDSTYGVKDWQVVKSQMDQEAQIMKQSMAVQEAAQQAAPQEEDEQAGTLTTASSGARGLFATFSKKRFLLPVPFSPFRRNRGTGFDPYAETPREGGPPHSPPGSPPSGAGHQHDAPHLEPPEPPQLGFALSRLRLTQGPDADEDNHTDGVTSEDVQAAARSVQMTDVEAGKHAADDANQQGESGIQHVLKKRDGVHAEGGKHVHMADAEDGGNLHGGKHSAELDRKKKMWDDMLKRKVAGDLGKQKNSDSLDDLTSTHSKEEKHTSRVNSQAALLGGGRSSSEWVPETLSPNPMSSHTHQLPPLEQARLLSKKGLLSALSNSKRLLPALTKKDDDLAEAAVRSGLTHQRSGGLASRMETAGSVDSNAPLLPAGISSEQASISNVQLAAAMTDGQGLTDGETDPGEAQSLEVAGFAGAVAQAYAAYDYVSLGIFTDCSLSRRFCMRVITNVYFEGFVLVLVLLSSVLLALDTPSLDDSSRLADVITICDFIFVACFTLEMCLKVVALGLVAHPGAYLRSPWNQLDAVVVITSIISTASPNNHVGILKALRLLRVLRPLRMISRFKGMQIVVLALIRSIPPISSVAMFGLFEFVIFAIIGIQLFAGRLGACNQVEIDGSYVQYRSQCIEGVTFTCNGTQDNNCNDGDATIRQWQVAFYNFDNMASALLSVVEVAVMDNYMDDCAYFLMDATGVDKQPQLWHNPWAGLYIVAVCFFLGLFWVNLLQGAIIDNYCRLIEQMGNGALLTDEQKKWLDVLRLKGTTRQGQKDSGLRPVNRIRSMCFDTVTHRWFDPAILSVIILNMVAICATYRGQGETYTNVLSDINIFFTAVYLAEAVLKNTAFGPWKYIKDNWNKLDLVIVILALVDIFVTSSKVSSLSSAFRIFRVVRLLKVLQQVK